MDRLMDYALPAAWRGVASPRYLRLARWQSLVEELGGVRFPDGPGQRALTGALVGTACEAGRSDMSPLTISTEPCQLEELRRFVAESCSRHERLVLMLFYADGLRLDEIAEVLDLPEATVNQLFCATLEALRERFA